MPKNETIIQVGPNVPITQHVTYRLTRLNAKLNAEAAKLLKEHGGISLGQWRVLVYLDTYDGGTQAGFVRFGGLDKGQSSRIVRDMVKAGLVSSVPGATDNRVHDLSMTEKGRFVFKTALPHMRKRQQRIYSSITDQERDVLYHALEKIEASIPGSDDT